MENNEENLGSQEPTTSTNTNPVKKTNTKLIGIIAIAVVVILAIVFMFLSRGAKATVKDYVKAMEKGDSSKVINLMDMIGVTAFESTKSDLAKFDEKYTEMKKDKEMQERVKKFKKEYKDQFKLDTDSKMKISVKNLKEEKVEGSKKLKKVTCTIKVKLGEMEDEKDDIEFYVVKDGLKHYVVSAGM